MFFLGGALVSSLLVEASLLGKNPAIRINKFETQAEKDFQEGCTSAISGL